MKNKIANKIYFLVSIILLLPAYLAQAESCPALNPGDPPPDTIGGKICNPAPGFFLDLFDKARYGNTFGGIFLFLIESGLTIVGLLSIGFLIWGGFQYITSRGDEEQATSGKKTISNAIIGLIIVILSYLMVAVLINVFRGNV